MSRLSRMILGTTVAVFPALSSSCRSTVCSPEYKYVACAAPTGTAKVAAPADLQLASAAQIAWATNCLGVDGTCSVIPEISLSAPRPDIGSLSVHIALPPL